MVGGFSRLVSHVVAIWSLEDFSWQLSCHKSVGFCLGDQCLAPSTALPLFSGKIDLSRAATDDRWWNLHGADVCGTWASAPRAKWASKDGT